MINYKVGKAAATKPATAPVKSISKKIVELDIAEQKIGVDISDELRQIYIDNTDHDNTILDLIGRTALLEAGKLSEYRNRIK